MNDEIWITGIGLVTPQGITVDSNWKAVCQGRPCEDGALATPFADKIVYIDEPKFLATSASAKAHNTNTDIRFLFSHEAASQAINDARLDSLKDAGVVVCCGKPTTGKQNKWLKAQTDTIHSFNSDIVLSTGIEHPVSQLAAQFGFEGPLLNVTAACATGLISIISAARIIRHGDADIMLAGAVEIAPDNCFLASYINMKTITDSFAHFRPFHTHRNGFFASEGSAMLILESAESARHRGVTPYAVIEDWCSLNDPSGLTAMDEDGIVITEILSRLSKNTEKTIDYINTHGTATLLNDRAEIRGIQKAFGSKVDELYLGATKPLTGHMFSVTGAVETIFTALTLQHQIIPPTIRLDEPDPECNLYFPTHLSTTKKIDRAISLSYGFGGPMAGILLRKP